MAKKVTKRSSVDGRFVTREYAKDNPETTIRERRRHWRAELHKLVQDWETSLEEGTLEPEQCINDIYKILERR